jgi:hypothetical protein
VKTIRFWEEVNANIWPAFESFLYDGWLLRITRGYSRNSNSVWPLYDGELSLEQKVRFCEQQYSIRGMTCGFRLPDISRNCQIEPKLKKLGYSRDNPNLVMVKSSMKNAAGEITEMGLEEWMETIFKIHPGDLEINKWEQKLPMTVNQSNIDAQRLYLRLGFETKYKYHYFLPQNEVD